MDELDYKALEQIPIPEGLEERLSAKLTSGRRKRSSRRPSTVHFCPELCAIQLLQPVSPSSLVWDIIC